MCTSFNSNSSRSHFIGILKIKDENSVGYLKICDLAGSEKNSMKDN